jgi:hypothetical protein
MSAPAALAPSGTRYFVGALGVVTAVLAFAAAGAPWYAYSPSTETSVAFTLATTCLTATGATACAVTGVERLAAAAALLAVAGVSAFAAAALALSRGAARCAPRAGRLGGAALAAAALGVCAAVVGLSLGVSGFAAHLAGVVLPGGYALLDVPAAGPALAATAFAFSVALAGAAAFDARAEALVPAWPAGRVFKSSYFYANVVYVCYAVIVLCIDFSAQTQANIAYPAAAATPTNDDYGYYDALGVAAMRSAYAVANRAYLAAAIIHVFNSLQYAHAWREGTDARTGKPYAWNSYVMVPEALNFIEASLYLASAIMYPGEVILAKSSGMGAFLDPVTASVKRVETAASVIHLCACFGWCFTWWATHARGRGRGLTLDDPDVWALMCLTVPSLVYVSYNALCIQDPNNYNSEFLNRLYTSADCVYFGNAFFYLLCSFRDEGYFNSLAVCGLVADRARAALGRAPLALREVAEADKAAAPRADAVGDAAGQA